MPSLLAVGCRSVYLGMTVMTVMNVVVVVVAVPSATDTDTVHGCG